MAVQRKRIGFTSGVWGIMALGAVFMSCNQVAYNPPARPDILAVTGKTATSITLTWTQNQSEDFMAYKIFRSNASGVTDLDYQVSTITNRLTTFYKDTGLGSDSVYYYKLYQYQGLGLVLQSNEIADSTLVAEPVKPDTIVLAVSKRTKTSITLSWTQCTNPDFVAYKIFRSDTSGVTELSAPVTTINSAITTTYTETGLDSGIVLYYRIYQYSKQSDVVVSKEIKTLTRSPENDDMVYIGPGTFLMGSENGRDNEKPKHLVTITKGFWMDRTEVTQEDYKALMGVNPSHFQDYSTSARPVEKVTWFDAVLYCNARSKRDGRDTVYQYTSVSGTPGDSCYALGGLNMRLTKNGYRLPTESEWEFACRAGTTTEYYWGNDSTVCDAWYWGNNSTEKTHSVATKLPNAYGLYDMSGNVWEFCNDYYGIYRFSTTDPVGPDSGSTRILRGGCWRDNATFLRSAFRSGSQPNGRSYFWGFRVVLQAQ